MSSDNNPHVRKPRRTEIKEGHAEINMEQEILREERREYNRNIEEMNQIDIETERRKYNKILENLRNVLHSTNKKKVVLDTFKKINYYYYFRDRPKLPHVQERFLHDEDIILEAIRTCSQDFEFVPDALQNDKEFIKKAVNVNPHVVRRVNNDTIDNDIDLYVTKITFCGLPYISHINRNMLLNDDFMIKVIMKCPNIYMDVYEKHKELCECILSRPCHYVDPMTLNSIDIYEKILSNKKYATILFENNPLMFCYASNVIKDTTNIVQSVIDKEPYMFMHVSNRLKDDKKMVMQVIEQLPMCLEYVSDKLKDDLDVVQLAFLGNEKSIKFASDKMKQKFVPNKEKIKKKKELDNLLSEGLKCVKKR